MAIGIGVSQVIHPKQALCVAVKYREEQLSRPVVCSARAVGGLIVGAVNDPPAVLHPSELGAAIKLAYSCCGGTVDEISIRDIGILS
jgi:hypothetical protein